MPGRVTGNFFSVAQSAMLVASGDWALLEHSLAEVGVVLRLYPKGRGGLIEN